MGENALHAVEKHVSCFVDGAGSMQYCHQLVTILTKYEEIVDFF